VNGQPAQTYPVALGVAPVGVGSEVPAQESGVGGEIVLRKAMGAGDGALTEIVRREGPIKYLIPGVNLQNLENPLAFWVSGKKDYKPSGRVLAPK